MLSRIDIRHKTVYLGLLLAISLIFSYVDSLILLFPMIPGAKLGLANLPVVICLFLLGPVEALTLTVLKAVLSSLLFGNAYSLAYSLGGAVLSFAVMFLIRKVKGIHIFTVSGMGGLFHNLGQLLVAFYIVKSKGVFIYLPYLTVMGTVTGSLLGALAQMILPGLKKFVNKGEIS